MATPLIQGPQLQSRILFLISQIQDAIYDPAFKELIIRVVGRGFSGADAVSLYRFYMRGSSVAGLHTGDITHFPYKFTSDIDMMVIVNPEIPAIQFNAIRGLLYKRVLDTILEFTRTNAVKYLDDFRITDKIYDKSEMRPDDPSPPPEQSKRAVPMSTPSTEDDPLNSIFNSSEEMMVGSGSMLKVAIANDIDYIDTTGESKRMGNGLITIIPRTEGALPVLDISFPKLNFFDSPDYSRIFYEWVESHSNTFYRFVVPDTELYSFRFDGGLFKKLHIGNGVFNGFTVDIPIISIRYAEIDAETSIETTKNPTKKEKRAKMAKNLRRIIVGY